MKKIIIAFNLALCSITIPSASTQNNESYTQRLVGQYSIKSRNMSELVRGQAWGLFTILISDAPKALNLTQPEEQDKLKNLISTSLFSAHQWNSNQTQDNKDLKESSLLLLAISALNGLSTLLQAHSIDTKTVSQIFTSPPTPILTILQTIIPEEMSIAAFFPNLKEALYAFLRSYHDRFGHQAFTDFKDLSKWIKDDINRPHSDSLSADIELLFAKMEDWETKIRRTAAALERDVQAE